MMYKKLCAALVAAAMCLALAACGGAQSSSASESQPVSSSQPESQPEPESASESAPESVSEENSSVADSKPAKAVPAGPTEFSDDLYSFQVKVNGVVYQIPTLYSSFAEQGWEIEGDVANEQLAPNYRSYSEAATHSDGSKVSLRFFNPGMDTMSQKDCFVGGISLDAYDAEKTGAVLELPGGITIGTPMDDVLAAYGEPSRRNDMDSGSKVFSYEQSTYNDIEIWIDEDGAVKEITVSNLDVPEDQIPEAVGSGEMPLEVENYTAPDALGESWDDFVAEYGDALYKLPAPVSVFMDNGWKVADAEVMIPARGSQGIDMMYNNQTHRTWVRNYTDSAQPAKYCFVTELVSNNKSGPTIPITLSGGLSSSMNYDDMVKMLGEADETDESSSYTAYEYGKYGQQLTVLIDKEDNSIWKIELDYEPKTLE